MNGTKKSKDAPQVIRRLSNNELYQIAKYTLDLYRGTSVSCRYVIPKEMTSESARPQLASTINKAIGRVVSLSPTLQAGISGAESRKPVWIPLSVNVNHHVTWKTVDESQDYDGVLQDVIRAELDERFFDLTERPGWRVVVLRGTKANTLDITFTWNHPHGDGTGGKIFHDLLLESLNTLLSSETTSTPSSSDAGDVTLEPNTSFTYFPPATETLAPLPITAKYLLQELWEDNKPPSLFPTPTQADWAPNPSSYSPTRFRVFSIDTTTLSTILTACRQHKTTLTALVNALTLFSLSKQLDPTKAPAFASCTAIDQRRFLPRHPPAFPWFDPDRTVGNYVSITSHQFPRDLVAQVRSSSPFPPTSSTTPALVWTVAAQVRAEIRARLELGLKNDIVGLMKFVPDWRAQMRSDVKKPRKPSWFVTNLGVVQGRVEGAGGQKKQDEEDAGKKWEINRAQFTLSTETPAAALLIGMCSVKGGDLVVTCTWQDSVVEEGLVKGVVVDLEAWLREVGKS